MFDSLHHFLYQNNLWIIPLALIVGGYFSWRIWVILHASPVPAGSLARPQSRRTPRPPDTPAKPIQQQFLAEKPASVVAGEESHKHKAQAPTIRIRPEDQRHTTSGGSTTELMPAKGDTPSVGDEVGRLFAGLDDTLQPAVNPSTAHPDGSEPKSGDSQRRASRLEVLGFHHSIESLKTPPPGSITAPPETPPSPTAAPAAPGAPGLDDILARLDRVLADDQPAKPAALPPAPPATSQTPAAPAADAKPPAAKAPMWARADAQDEDLDAKPVDPGQQLGLFDQDKKA